MKARWHHRERERIGASELRGAPAGGEARMRRANQPGCPAGVSALCFVICSNEQADEEATGAELKKPRRTSVAKITREITQPGFTSLPHEAAAGLILRLFLDVQLAGVSSITSMRDLDHCSLAH